MFWADPMEYQVPDDMDLLEQMMEDLERCDEFYRPTSYWIHLQKSFLPELRGKGLGDFRRRKGSVLSSFGATDLLIDGILAIKPSFRGAKRLTAFLNAFIDWFPLLELEIPAMNPLWLTSYFYRHVKSKYEAIGLELRRCPTSKFGNPEDLETIGNGVWSTIHLQYCSMFADAAKHIGFKPDGVFCELGAGLGRNVEIIGQVFENTTALVFDIPPQLYVANQYLQTIFGSRVISYREAISLIPPKDGSIPKGLVGKIIVLPTWRMPDWSNTKIDVFWNSASFQEMEPDVVSNYLSRVASMCPEWIFINALPMGNYWGEWKPGRGGTEAPVMESCYMETLQALYSLHCMYHTDYFLRTNDYRSYIFRRT